MALMNILATAQGGALYTNLGKAVDLDPAEIEAAMAAMCPAIARQLKAKSQDDPDAFETLRQHGILFARRGGAPEYPYEEGRGFAFEPGKDHPLLIPSAGDARPKWSLPDFVRAVEQARDGRIAVLQFHGAPDTAHHWVSSPRENFEAYMKYLKIEGYRVIALRDLQDYVDPNVAPSDWNSVINDRKKQVEALSSSK